MTDPRLTDGDIVDDITKIVFEPLGNGRFRWTLWSNDTLYHTEIGYPEDLEAMIFTTAIFCGGPIHLENVIENQHSGKKKIDTQSDSVLHGLA